MILVTSSHPLSVENKDLIINKIVSKYSVKESNIVFKIDPNMKLGITIEYNNKITGFSFQNTFVKILSEVIS